MDELTASQRYYLNHKEERKAYGRKYYHDNKERILDSIRKRNQLQPRLQP
jgi:hypothetical protein